MPLGLRNASSVFQRIVDSLFSDTDYPFTYFCDILISVRVKGYDSVIFPCYNLSARCNKPPESEV